MSVRFRLTKAFRSLIAPAAIAQTGTGHGTMQIELRKTRVANHSALWVIILFLGRGVPVTIYWVAWVWAADA